MCRQAVHRLQVFFLIPLLRHSAGYGIANRQLPRGEMAHQTKHSEPAAEVATQVEDQAVAIGKALYCVIDLP